MSTETENPDGYEHPDCGHKNWRMGCARCWEEISRVAQGHIVAQADDATLQGAIMMAWHMMLVLQQSQAKLEPKRRSLDIRQAEQAEAVAMNFLALSDHLVSLVADPRKLDTAMRQAAVIAQEAQKHSAEMQAATPSETPAPTPANPSPIILTDA
jgi:hypothetical protein